MQTVAMSGWRTAVLTALALAAFAGNSLLCRAALRDTPMDAATFTAIRIASGAVALWLIVRCRAPSAARAGRWSAALALFIACWRIYQQQRSQRSDAVAGPS